MGSGRWVNVMAALPLTPGPLAGSDTVTLPEAQRRPPLRLSPKSSELFLNPKPIEQGSSLAWLLGPPPVGPRLPWLPLTQLPSSYTSL